MSRMSNKMKTKTEINQNPIKITWQNVDYTVQINTTKEEKKEGMGKKKPF